MTGPDSPLTKILELWRRAPKPPEETEPVGATLTQLEELHELLGFVVPPELGQWLLRCNGTFAGPGGIYGTRTSNAALSIERQYEIYPGWLGRKWVPIAGDGCGNTYVVDAGHRFLATDAVYFVDSMESVDEPSHAVASGVLAFLRFLLAKENGEQGWPFDRSSFVTRDPHLLSLAEPDLMPWN